MSHQMFSLFSQVLLLAWFAVPLHALTDDFDEDPLLSGDWELYEPVVGAVTFTTEDGILRVTIPANINLDHWVAVDQATQLRRDDMPDDFIMETRVYFVGSGDPFSPQWPPVNQSYQPCLMVYFSSNDVFQWGFYRGTNLRLERSGQNNLCELDPGLREVSLQVKKIGTLYSFSWRADDAEDWNLVCNQEAFEPPTFVGYMFKSWNPLLTLEETFEFDYFTLDEPPEVLPAITMDCDPDPDTAMVGLPYTRTMRIDGFPQPTVEITEGPQSLAYDPILEVLTGWIPDTAETLTISVEATNTAGTDTASWTVEVSDEPDQHDDDFDDDPRDNVAYWEFYEPLGGITFSSSDDGDTWWRMEVPAGPYDNWVAVDNAPQLRHRIDGSQDFLIETRVRLDPDNLFPPLIADPFLAGLMVWFGQYDLIHWNIGQERTVGGQTYNIFMERSGVNNIIRGGLALNLVFGTPVGLRVEKKCDLYYFYYLIEGEDIWVLAGTYQTPDEPLYVGLIMKTWGAGTAWTVDFDYFNFTGEELPVEAPTLLTPCDFGDPDIAYLGMPYARPIKMEGLPPPVLSITSGPAGLAVNPLLSTISGWTPDALGKVSIGLEATNNLGSDTLTLSVEVVDAPDNHDDDFDDDPRDNVDYWEFREPQPGINYDIVDFDGSSGWRLEVPAVDEFGAPVVFDSWTTVASAPQLLHAVDPDQNFLIETRVRIDPDFPPATTDPFFAGLAIHFDDFDILQWTVGQERIRGLGLFSNIILERSGFNNLILGGFEPGLVLGAPVRLRVEKVCTTYNFLYHLEDDDAWTLAGSYQTDTTPLYVGLVVKTWGGGAAVNVDFDYFDIVGPGGEIPEICDNQVDDDGDTLVDCDDPDCADADPCVGGRFVRGDSNADGSRNITDGVFVFSFLFTGGEDPPCMDAADTSDQGSINITSGIYILNFLFLGGPEPPAPFPGCAADPTPEVTELGCESFPPCEA